MYVDQKGQLLISCCSGVPHVDFIFMVYTPLVLDPAPAVCGRYCSCWSSGGLSISFLDLTSTVSLLSHVAPRKEIECYPKSET